LPWNTGPASHGILARHAVESAPVKCLIAQELLEYLKSHTNVPSNPLAYVLEILNACTDANIRTQLLELAVARLSDDDLDKASLYAGAAFAVDPDAAANAIERRLGQLSPANQTGLVERLLPLLFGDRGSPLAPYPKELPFSCLLKLVRLAYSTVRVSEDSNRPSGVAYSPDQRDRAEWARSAAFKKLTETPGRATYEALLELGRVPDFPIAPDHLKSLAMQRAAADAEHAPWLPEDAKTFESAKETPPKTPIDLKRLAANRLADLQHDLLNAAFAQGKTLKQQPNERAVQNWIAAELDHRKGISYSVERESHVVEEKEPDVTLRAKQSHASLPIEIKVAESWTFTQLQEALTEQLCGQYLRSREARHGILLLVHQQGRPMGWKDESGAFMDFATVVQRLTEMANRIAAEGPDAAQPSVVVVDVSGVPSG
jgi:hypothetical protein